MAGSYLPGLDNFPSGIDEDRLAAGLLAVEQGRHSQQSVTEAVLVSGVDATLGEDIVCTLTANRVLGRPLNGVPGQRLQLVLTQGGAGNFTLTAGSGVTLSNFALNATAGAVTTGSLVCLSPTSWVLASNPPLGTATSPVQGVIRDWGGGLFHIQAPQNPGGAAKWDGRSVTDASMNSGVNPTFLTSATAAFTSADVGKLCTVVGAGSGSPAGVLVTTIASINSATVAVLAAPCSTTVSGALAAWASDDSAALAGLVTYLNTNNGTGILPAGIAAFGATPIPTMTNILSSLIGPSSGNCVMYYTGNATFLKLKGTPFQNHPGVPYPSSTASILQGFTIEGVAAGASAVGLEYGDAVGGQLTDIEIQHFKGANGIGLWFHNELGFSERLNVNRVSLNDNKLGVKFSKDDTNATTTSFGYCRFDFKFEINDTQKGISVQSSGANPIQVYSGSIMAHANMGGTSTFIELTGNASVLDPWVTLTAEGPGATCTFANINDAGGARWRSIGVLIPGVVSGALMPIVGTMQGLDLGSVAGGTNPGDVFATLTGLGAGNHYPKYRMKYGANTLDMWIDNQGYFNVGFNGGATMFILGNSGWIQMQGALAKKTAAVALNGGTVQPNGTNADTFLCALSASTTLNVPLFPVSGTEYTLVITHDATANVYVLTMNAAYRIAGGGTTLPVTNTASKRDVFVFEYDGTSFNEISRSLNM